MHLFRVPARDLALKIRCTLKNKDPLYAAKTTLSVNGPPSTEKSVSRDLESFLALVLITHNFHLGTCNSFKNEILA